MVVAVTIWCTKSFKTLVHGVNEPKFLGGNSRNHYLDSGDSDLHKGRDLYMQGLLTRQPVCSGSSVGWRRSAQPCPLSSPPLSSPSPQ